MHTACLAGVNYRCELQVSGFAVMEYLQLFLVALRVEVLYVVVLIAEARFPCRNHDQ